MRIDGIGLRSSGLRMAEAAAAVDAAGEAEALGYSALWIPAGGPDGLEDRLAALLRATRTIVIATSVVSIWVHRASDIAAMQKRLQTAYPDRFLLGLGVSHEPLVSAQGGAYGRPLAAMREYLDGLDRGGGPPGPRVLGALGPRMLQLAAERTLGSHPFLAPPAHTAFCRGVLGTESLLAPDLKVTLEADASTARAAGRAAMSLHLTLPNYVNNLTRTGFSEDDVRDGGSDRLIDALVAWGGRDAVRRLAAEHRAAGADHVVLEPITGERSEIPLDVWRELAP